MIKNRNKLTHKKEEKAERWRLKKHNKKIVRKKKKDKEKEIKKKR